MVIEQLKVQIENLQAGAIVNNLENIPHDTQELQSMLEEGKAKLQKALTKSLDNEQKLIRYEHDMNQQKKQLNDMENLLKVRDGLISMLKVKKDELVLENESLHRYSEEIRQLLFDVSIPRYVCRYTHTYVCMYVCTSIGAMSCMCVELLFGFITF